jgi:predicted ATPase
MPYDVFISHSSKDKPAADAVCSAIEANGLRCWIAPRDIVGGTDWSSAIVAALEECPAIVLIFSENANASEQVKREVQRSFEKRKIVVPFRIDNVIPTGSMEYYLAPVHWLDASDGRVDAHLPLLIDSLSKRLSLTADQPSAGLHISSLPSPWKGDGAPAAAASTGSAATSVPAGNLPPLVAPYIGRTDELAAWQTILLSGGIRVLTLLGFGGLGKTRSALEIAHRVAGNYADGAWWAPLEEAHDGPEALRRIAVALGVDLSAQEPVKDRLIAFLKARTMLLVLDNTEQIPDAATFVNDLVAGAPGVQFLVTSRRSLELAAEQVIEVPSLPATDAAALFADRARARQPDFTITDANAADVARICERLEGMPLAIELAASRTSAMTPREIFERLGEWTKLLNTRAPHLPPRQRAIQGAIEWSHELLTDDDKALFSQLSVFASGFTLSAAESVCDCFDVFEGVHELRKHSFLRAQAYAATQQTRFFMLELVREYAHEKLSGEQIALRHAEFFLRFAEERVAKLRTPQEALALEELSADMGNLREALATAKKLGNDDLLTSLALAVAEPMRYLGIWAEAKRVLGDAIATMERGGVGSVGALRSQLAAVSIDLGDPDGADKQAADAVDAFKAVGDDAGVARALNMRGLAAVARGDAESGSGYFRQALDLWGNGDRAGRGIALHNLAMLALAGGDEAAARDLYGQSLADRRSGGDKRGEAETLGNIGALEYRAGNYESARSLYVESLRLRQALRDRLGVAVMLYNLAELAEVSKDNERAVGLYAHAESLFRELGSGYADAVRANLDAIRQTVGDDAYALAREAALRDGWEGLVDCAG